ncbi:hypothetical protein CR105_26620 [Massilia eurypsychrophila]|uniref:Uncharacterized protein n=1 Tax=Massilia eurypsychrophila TaxID=1485217 RepID=A0A2G8T7I5_9BURK|nr:hypothetical protein CR105_26620 [Massilia eurypsychrophila]
MSLASTAQALLSRFTHDTRLLKLTTPLGAGLLAECVRAEEGLSEGFVVRIAALSTDAAIPLKALIGQPVLLELATVGGAGWRAFHGHITQVELIGANGGFARYEQRRQHRPLAQRSGIANQCHRHHQRGLSLARHAPCPGSHGRTWLYDADQPRQPRRVWLPDAPAWRAHRQAADGGVRGAAASAHRRRHGPHAGARHDIHAD